MRAKQADSGACAQPDAFSRTAGSAVCQAHHRWAAQASVRTPA